MQISYQNQFKDKGHKCEALIIRCMDFRFHKALGENIGQIIGSENCSYDSPGVGGGGSKSIIDEESRKVVFSAIDIAKEIHHIKKIIIADHIDCGAYDGSSKFENKEREKEFHIEKLNQAGNIIAEHYPNLDLVLVYQDWETIEIINK